MDFSQPRPSAPRGKADDESTYCFIVEWFDSQADLVRKYQLFFFAADNTLEMYDVKARRTFLKRCAYPSIKLSDLYLGAQISVYSRQLKVVNYGDEFTRKKLENKKEKTFSIIKSEGYEALGKILDLASKHNITLARAKMVLLSLEQAQQFFGQSRADLSSFCVGPIVAVELVGEGVVLQWPKFLQSASDAKIGRKLSDFVYSSTSPNAVDRESSFFFDNSAIKTSAQLKDCAVCVIKPHVATSGSTGAVVDAILEEGYEISALEIFQLEKQTAEEFLEIYKTVVPEYHAMVDQLASGPCVALEIRSDSDVVSSFRETAGPMDPEIARHIRPQTLRAKFGIDRVRNGVHCTDLPEDGPLESEFFFSILQPRH